MKIMLKLPSVTTPNRENKALNSLVVMYDDNPINEIRNQNLDKFRANILILMIERGHTADEELRALCFRHNRCFFYGPNSGRVPP